MKDSSRESDVMSALAREFCAFMVRASGLQSKLEGFMENKSLLFKGGNLLEEQKLEWTLLHKEYIELAEQHMEEFLQERSATAEEVAQTLHESLGKSLWSLPLLQSLDYESFAAQMIARASAPQLQSEALASGGIFGGIWKLQQSEPRHLERFLKAQGVPWILRRLHIFAEIREVCIVEMPGTVPMFTLLHLRDHGFGVSEEQVVADGAERTDGRFSTRAWLTDRELHIVTRPVDGSRSVLQTTYTVASDGNSLLLRRSSEDTVLNTLIDDEASWFVTQLFQRSEPTQKADCGTCRSRDTEPVETAITSPSKGYLREPSEPQSPEPEPELRAQCVLQDTEKVNHAFNLLHEVRAAVMEQAESRIDDRLRQLCSQAASEVLSDNYWKTAQLPLCPDEKLQDMPMNASGGSTPSTATSETSTGSAASSNGSPVTGKIANSTTSMPEIPPFTYPFGVYNGPFLNGPFPNASQSWAPTAVSLADALGIAPKQQVEETEDEEPDAFVFKLTLRVADDGDLGLRFSRKGEVLRIDSVQSGAAESWNRQCSSGTLDRILRPGDLVISVNEESDPEAMMEECKRMLVKLRILRLGSENKNAKAAKPQEAGKPWASQMQYPLTFPTGLGYGSRSLSLILLLLVSSLSLRPRSW
ncbi:Coatomer subunit beta [Durusdinium trenchii]|uniref:Cilia- and flagella-associated protein 36 n=1 Tax=Durusdinium trenchii TaxID=1381693 RepID=A0ABP0I5Z7_9DINO